MTKSRAIQAAKSVLFKTSAAYQLKNLNSISLLKVEERAAEFYSMLIFKEVSSKHSGAYTCVASNSAARANYTAHLMVKGKLLHLLRINGIFVSECFCIILLLL